MTRAILHSISVSHLQAAFAFLLAITCSSVSADEIPKAKKVATQTAATSPAAIDSETSANTQPWRPALRLSTGASARGWLGRMPARRKRTAAVSKMPAPAPLTDPTESSSAKVKAVPATAVDANVYPEPLPPKRIRRSATIAPIDVSNALPETTPSKNIKQKTEQAAEVAVPLLQFGNTQTPKNAVKLQTISQSLQLPQATQSKASSPAPKTPGADVDEAADAEDQEAEDAPAPPTLDRLLDGRLLGDITLFSSIQPTTLTGEELKQPQDQAGAIYDAFGVYQELPAVHNRFRHHQYPICFNPLYFEDPNMERCGIGHGCFTDVVSVVRFFGRAPLVPYLAGANPPLSCVPSLGDCPTCHSFDCEAYIPRRSIEGTALQTACTVGLIFLLP